MEASRPRVSRKIVRFTESVIREMTRLAILHGAINLAQGMPDFAAPGRIKTAAMNAIRDDYNQYEITWGSVELRQEISEKLRKFNGIEANPEQNITVTCGSTEAMVATVVAVTDHGDEVIIPEPFYENYVPATLISGATPKHVMLDEPDFGFNEEELKKAFNARTKAIILNTPNNPTGKVFGADELRLVADLCEDHGVIAITDEIYEYIVYDGRKHISIASVRNMRDRTVTISGLSKTFSVTGWRIGYAVAEKELTNAIRKVHDFMTVCAPAPLQKAGVSALKMPPSYYTALAEKYEEKRDFMMKALQEIGFKLVTPQGAYYILADFGGLSSDDDTTFARKLVREEKVAVVPASSFYSRPEAGKTRVRFTFAKKDRTLREGVARLRKLRHG